MPSAIAVAHHFGPLQSWIVILAIIGVVAAFIADHWERD